MIKKKLTSPFKNRRGVDNDEVTVGGKGMRWGFFVVVLIIAVIGLTIAMPFFNKWKNAATTNLNKIDTTMTNTTPTSN